MVSEQLNTSLKKNKKLIYFVTTLSLIYFFSTPNIFSLITGGQSIFSLEADPFQFNEMSNRILFPLISYVIKNYIFFRFNNYKSFSPINKSCNYNFVNNH